jgi:hypothetical protein
VGIPDQFAGHHVSAVRQERWDRLEPHPTVCRSSTTPEPPPIRAR